MPTQKITYTASASLKTAGITPAAGPAATIADSLSFSSTNVSTDDSHVKTHVVNAGTTSTALNLGAITTGKALWISSSGDIEVYVTQDFSGAAAEENRYLVKSFLLLESDFAVVKLANPGGTAVNVSVAIVGTRDAVGGGVGIF